MTFVISYQRPIENCTVEISSAATSSLYREWRDLDSRCDALSKSPNNAGLTELRIKRDQVREALVVMLRGSIPEGHTITDIYADEPADDYDIK